MGFFLFFEIVKLLYMKCKKGVIVICFWGIKGVDGIGLENMEIYSDVFLFEKVIDIFGVGDIFVVGVIWSFM